MKCRKSILYGGVSVVGAGLAVLFLIDDRWMKNPRYNKKRVCLPKVLICRFFESPRMAVPRIEAL